MPNLIGTAPDQVPVNGFLGNMAFQNKEGVVTDLLSTTALTVTGTASFAGTIAAGLGSAAAPSYTFIGDTNTGIFSPGADTIAFSEGGVEAMRITSAGLVGIGTTSPASKLHVESTSGAAGSAVARLTVTGTNGLEVGQEFFSTLVSGSTTALRSGRIYSKFDGSSYVSSRLSFQSMTTSNVLVDTMHLKNGSVGIGTSSPNTKLAVEGSACEISINDTAGTIAGLRFRTSGATKGVIQADSTSNLRFSSGATEAMRILSSGNVGIGTSSPIAKLDVVGSGLVTKFGSSSALSAYTGWQYNSTTLGYVGNGSGVASGAGATDFAIGSTGARALVFGSNDTERARIDSAGDVGIGTATPDIFGRFYTRTVGINSSGTSMLQINGTTYGGIDLGFNGTRTATMLAETGGFYLQTNTAAAMSLGTNGLERMRIDSSGNVLVGTTTANGRLSVVGDQISITSGAGSATLGLQIKGTALTAIPAGQIQGYIATGDSGIGTAGDLLLAPRTDIACNIRFITGASPAERMRIDSSGNLLVGKTASSGGVNGFEANASGFASTASGTFAGWMNRKTSDGDILLFNRDATQVGSVSVTTTATAYNTSSDYRLKDIDGPISNSGTYIDALKPVQGSWKSDGSRFIGLLAHEVQEVSETPIATGEKDGEEMQAMDYSAPELIANLIAEIQSLRARVAQLEGN